MPNNLPPDTPPGGEGGPPPDPPPAGLYGPALFLLEPRDVAEVSCAAPTMLLLELDFANELEVETPFTVFLPEVEMEEV